MVDKKTTNNIQKSGVFLDYDPRSLVHYLEQFKYADESENHFLTRLFGVYNPSLFLSWRKGTRPSVDKLKEIWWQLRHDGCQFSTLMRLTYGVECREPEVSKYYSRQS